MTEGPSPTRLHPFTSAVLATGTAILSLALPPWEGPLFLFLVVALVVLASRVRGTLWHGFLLVAPLWFFLVLIHAVLADPGPDPVMIGGRTLAREGLHLALAQGSRLGVIILVTLTWYRTLDTSRLLDAVAARGGRVAWTGTWLAIATLHTIHRFQDRTRAILAAQRARGLRLTGSPVRRIRALRPLLVPLLLGALIEVDERALGLETRGLPSRRPRTPLASPPITFLDHLLRGGIVLAVIATILYRFFR